MATLNLHGFTLGIHVWYLNPPTPPLNAQIMMNPINPIETILHPNLGIKMNSSVSIATPHFSTKTEDKTLKPSIEPYPPPTCSLCDVQGHVTQHCTSFPILCTHMHTVVETDDAPFVNVPTIPMVKNKSLRANHPCVFCG